MNLLADIGNSRIKWAWFDGEKLYSHGAVFYTDRQINEQLGEYWTTMEKPERVLVSSVAGSKVMDQLVDWTQEHWQIKPEIIRVTKSCAGVENGYRELNQLGIDRWLAVIATWKRFHAAACIVDCGTAVTIDGIDNKGKHLGGLIIPGTFMMQTAMSNRASGIPEIDNIKPDTGLADNTKQALVNGCYQAVASLINHTAGEMTTRVGGKINFVITGGDAENIMNFLTTEFIHVPDLVLEGLAVIAGDAS